MEAKETDQQDPVIPVQFFNLTDILGGNAGGSEQDHMLKAAEARATSRQVSEGIETVMRLGAQSQFDLSLELLQRMKAKIEDLDAQLRDYYNFIEGFGQPKQ